MKKYIKNKVKDFLIKRFSIKQKLPSSYSQDSEDDILEKIFLGKNEGFFIDIGAHHPTIYSNTYKFYLKGWSGINIDPRQGIMELFDEVRPRDINLGIGIGERSEEIDFYVFNQPAVNTFQREVALGRNIINGFKLLRIEKVKVEPLLDVLNQYVGNKKIDFLTIDVEGYEINILRQNDWSKFMPKVIICEMLFDKVIENPNPIKCSHGSEYWSLVEDLDKFETHKLLLDKGYGVLSKGVGSVIYVDKKANWDF